MSISWNASLPIRADRDVAGDRDHRDRVEQRGADAGDEVRRAGAGRAHAHADLAGDAGVAVGGVGAALLVADEDVAELRDSRRGRRRGAGSRRPDSRRRRRRPGAGAPRTRRRRRCGSDAAAGRRRASPGGRARRPRAPAVPSAGTWLRRVRPARVGLGGWAVGPFVIVIDPCLPSNCCRREPVRLAVIPARVAPCSWHQKTLATRRGSRWLSVVRRRLAPVPPRSSVLPPGAGNEEPKKALKTDDEGAKETEERAVRQTGVVQGHLDTPTIRANRDGDVASIAAIEQTQGWSPERAR